MPLEEVDTRCKKCKNNVSNGLKCITCGVLFHPSCAKLINKIKIINSSQVNCCATNSEFEGSDKLSPGVDLAHDQTAEIAYLKSIIDMKNDLIRELREKNEILTNHIKLINIVEKTSTFLDNIAKVEAYQTKKAGVAKEISDKTGISQKRECSLFNGKGTRTYEKNDNKNESSTETKLNPSVWENEQRSVMNEIININDDLKTDDDRESSSFKLVERRRKMKREQTKARYTIVGANTKQSSLHAPAKKAWIYVGGCEENTTCDTVKNYIKEGCPDATDVECKQLTTLGRLKAFQVAFDFSFHDKIVDSAFWPSNIKVRRFNFNPKSNKIPTFQEKAVILEQAK